MERFKDLLKRANPVALAAAAIVLAAFVGLTAVRCSAVHAPGEDESAQQQEQQAEQDLGPHVSEEQQALIDAYDDEAAELVSLLAANSWTAQDEQKSLAFTENAFTESDGTSNASTEHTFAISSVEKTTSRAVGANGEVQEETTYQTAILTDQGTQLLTVRQVGLSGTQPQIAVTSNAFEFSDSYLLSHSAESMAVSGINEQFTDLLGGSSEKLKSALVEHCSRFYPTAKNAQWAALASIDWEAGSITTSFDLDNAAKTTVTAVVDMETGEVTVE